MKRLFAILLALFALCPAIMAQRAIMPSPYLQFWNSLGKPLAGGRLWTYNAGTTTPLATFSDALGSSANTNPIILSITGQAKVWGTCQAYKLILEDGNCAYRDIYGTCHGNLLQTVDNIMPACSSSATTITLAGDVIGSTGANKVVAIQGNDVSSATPTDGQTLIFNTAAGQWQPGTSTGFVQFTGPTSVVRTFSLPDQNDTIATWGQVNIFAKAQVVAPVTLSISSSAIATDASAGNLFRVTLDTTCAPCTLSNPTNATDGQIATWEVIQYSGGSKTLSLGSQFSFGTTVTGYSVTATASKRDFIRAVYNDAATKWFVTSVSQGY